MASRRRRRKGIGKVLTTVERKVRRIEKRPGAKRVKTNSITTEKIVPRAVETKKIAEDAVTPNEASFGTTFVTDTEPTEYLKEGTTWFNPDDGSTSVYDPTTSDFIELTAVDYTARASADGKNTIYRQDYEPSGGTYALGDVWFDTDDSNKLYRYSTAISATVTNKALSSNIATLTVSAPHSFVVGETITVSGVDATFDGSYTVSATPTSLTVRYAKTASTVTSQSASGTITNTAGWKGFQLGDGALLNIAANKISAGSLDAGVIVTSNLDAGQITTGSLDAARISAGSITAAKLSATAIDGKTITGAVIRQASSGTRIVMDAASPGRIDFYSVNETYPGFLEIKNETINSSSVNTVTLTPPYTSGSISSLKMYDTGGSGVTQISSTAITLAASSVGILSTGNLGFTYINNVSTSLSIIRNIAAFTSLPSASGYYEGSIFLVYA